MQSLLIVKNKNLYVAECWQNYLYDALGNIVKKLDTPVLRWKESFWNIVVTAGLNKLLDATFKSGLASPAWFVGLKGTGSIIAADTMGSHAGWSDIVPYSDATRPAFTPGTISAGAVDNSAARATFNCNATATVFGCFLTDSATKSGTTGTLYGGGDFGTSRPVINGDTLNITITLTQVTA